MIDNGYYAPVTIGEVYTLIMPWSEACMSARLADTAHPVKVCGNGAYIDSGRGPHMTWGEAGIMTADDGSLYARHAGAPVKATGGATAASLAALGAAIAGAPTAASLAALGAAIVGNR